jgi:hypothetical protein
MTRRAIDEPTAEQLVHVRDSFKHEVWAIPVSLLVCIVKMIVSSGGERRRKSPGPKHSAAPVPVPRTLPKEEAGVGAAAATLQPVCAYAWR